MSKKKKKKYIKYRKYRKNKNRNVIEKYYKRRDAYLNNINNEIDEILVKERKNNYIILLFSIFIILLSIIVLMFLNYPFISIIGKREVSIEYNNNYVDKGAKGVKGFKDISSDIIISNNVDTSRVGTYSIKYSYKYLFFNITKERVIRVIDNKSPIISLEGNEVKDICPNGEYIEEGYKAIDEYEGDISSLVVRADMGDYISYVVKDSSGNEASIKRKINRVDKENPSISLAGNETIYLIVGNNYNEAGYSAMDNCDGDISSKVITSNNIDINTVGTYSVTYKVSDSSDNETIISRKVIVMNKRNDGKGIIYLTFDDGPSNSITSKLLDILKNEGVSATFFVIANCNNFNSLVKREYDEGHMVALHSYTHKYDNIYSSIDSYFNDLNLIRNKVYNATGEYSNIIRFPGGSSNTISKNYSLGIMSSLTNKVMENDYHYFDWNISSGDAGGVSSSKEVYNNVVNNLSHDRENVVLMHDFEGNYYTLNALKDIIEYGKNNGYTFSKITMDTNEIHHRVAN